MLEVLEARQHILNNLTPLKPEITALTSTALGLVLAVDQIADLDSPPFSKSMMDGYAVRAEDLRTAGSLHLVEAIAAGGKSTRVLQPGECVRIFTGAPIPEGADAVVKQEHCQVNGNRVQFHEAARTGQNIFPQGAEFKAGDVVVPKGTIINPQCFGLFSAVGKTAVPTYSLPKVCVVATGNELVEPNTKPQGAKIRNTNGPMLMAQCARAGSLPRYLGIARDDRVVLASAIQEGLGTSHVLILSGGVSVGDHDLVPEVLREQGVQIDFHSVRMKPGKPLLFGRKDDVLVFGLPGNPVSAFVGFELFIRPALEVFNGLGDSSSVKGMPLAEPLNVSSDRPLYLPAKLLGDTVKPLTWLGSADLRSLLNADVLLELPAGELSYPTGHTVIVRKL